MRGYYKQDYVNKFENTYKMDGENCQNLLEKKQNTYMVLWSLIKIKQQLQIFLDYYIGSRQFYR